MTSNPRDPRDPRPRRGRPSGARPARGRSSPAGRPGRAGPSDQPSRLLRIAVAAIVVAGLVAVALTLVADEDDEATGFDTDEASVEGPALAPFPETGRDPAAGVRAPVVEGRDRGGAARRAPVEGRPTVLLFLAHWCPHCEREVPAMQGWADAGQLPEDADLVAVSTAVDPERPNFPPSAWFDDAGWTLPTIADAGGQAAAAYGLTAFPFWVAIDGQGRVVERRTGELGLSQVRLLVSHAAENVTGR